MADGCSVFDRLKYCTTMIKIKRIYEEPAEGDGFRILVDRLWPRGMKKENAAIDLWLRDVAPSNELRKWFAHDVEKWQDFQDRYKAELLDGDGMTKLREAVAANPVVTLLFAAKDVEHNNAVVLKSVLENQ